jgi:hypothetical protein
LKQKLTYNREDCSALQTVSNACEKIGNDPLATVTSCPTKLADEIKANKPLGIFKRNDFVFPELDKINKRAYWNYQQAKIYLRASSIVRMKGSNNKGAPRIKSTYRINRRVEPDRPKRCPKCNARKPMKHTHHARIVFDLKMFTGGIKRLVSKYDFTRYMCKKCKKTSTAPLNDHDLSSKYGTTLVAWIIYQSIGRLKSQNAIIEDLSEVFDYQLSPSIIARFKERAANEYRKMSEGLLNNVLDGSLIHIDETKISIKGVNGYVWAIANTDNVIYLFNSSREAGMIKEKLINFKGILVSDFYTAYDSVCCPQQKCLIHLIRDINDDILKNPFDDEMKEIGRDFTMTLSPIVDTIDKYGLNRLHLGKHKNQVHRFFKKVQNKEYTSDQLGISKDVYEIRR